MSFSARSFLGGLVLVGCSSASQDLGGNSDPIEQKPPSEVTTEETPDGATFTPDGGGTAVQNGWHPIATKDAPSKRSHHTAVWTGSEMIVWGGFDGHEDLSTGARYSPKSDQWSEVPRDGAPASREGHSAIWTGTEMIVWGGYSDNVYIDDVYHDTGGRYDPLTDTWHSLRSADAPRARRNHVAFWTGSRMIVWGGEGKDGSVEGGGQYDPTTDSWEPIAVRRAPTARAGGSSVWSGAELLFWGGQAGPDDEPSHGRYNPVQDRWSPLVPPERSDHQPSSRYEHTAIWTGAKMIVWGGRSNSWAAPHILAKGSVYDPTTLSWTELSAEGAPSGRCRHSAVWTGSKMLVWGGEDEDDVVSTGGVYDFDTGKWSELPTKTNMAPTGRVYHSAVWTGTSMLVWGGIDEHGEYSNRGARYTP